MFGDERGDYVERPQIFSSDILALGGSVSEIRGGYVERPQERWVLGAAGAGKSTFVAARGWPNVIDQDAELERLVGDGPYAWPLTELRARATATTWARVPVLRAARVDLTFQTPGDKPDLLAAEIATGRAAGYRELGYGLRVPLDVCLARNRGRRRVLPDDVVVATWEAFERNLPLYATLFDSFELA
jgi:hypothetical protein